MRRTVEIWGVNKYIRISLRNVKSNLPIALNPESNALINALGKIKFKKYLKGNLNGVILYYTYSY